MEEKINEINNKKIFFLSFKLNKYKFFPGETIEGKFSISTNSEILDKKELKNTNISFSLNQSTFFKVEEINFANNTIENKFDNNSKLIEQQIINYDELKNKIIENELELPFQFLIPPIQQSNSQVFYPSFRFISPKISCFVHHFLSIEIPGESNKYSQSIFINKIPNKNFEKKNNNNDELETQIFKETPVKKMKLFNAGRLNYFIKIKKSIQYNEENIPIEIHLDQTELKNLKVKKINLSLKKKLTLKKSARFFNEKISEKKISIINNTKNNVIKENVQFNIEDFPDLPIEEINKTYKNIINELEMIENNEKAIKKKKIYNFTPPIETEFFKLVYLIQIIFDLDNKLAENKKILIPIDFYDGEYNKLNLNINSKAEEDGENKDNIIYNENEINNIENENNNEGEMNNGFTIINTEDFIDIIDGKIKFGK